MSQKKQDKKALTWLTTSSLVLGSVGALATTQLDASTLLSCSALGSGEKVREIVLETGSVSNASAEALAAVPAQSCPVSLEDTEDQVAAGYGTYGSNSDHGNGNGNSGKHNDNGNNGNHNGNGNNGNGNNGNGMNGNGTMNGNNNGGNGQNNQGGSWWQSRGRGQNQRMRQGSMRGNRQNMNNQNGWGNSNSGNHQGQGTWGNGNGQKNGQNNGQNNGQMPPKKNTGSEGKCGEGTCG